MPRIARVGIDSAGGLILGGGQSTVRIGGALVAVVGDPVAPHGDGVHASATLVAGSPTVFAEGKAVVREGDPASCGHRVSSSASVHADDGGAVIPGTSGLAYTRVIAIDGRLSDALWVEFERGIQVPIAESLALAEDLAEAAAFVRSLADSGRGLDALTLALAQSATTQDTGTLPDALAQSAHYYRTLTDSLRLRDGIIGPDTPFGFDGAGAGFDLAPFERESWTPDAGELADSLRTQSAYRRSLADTGLLADSLFHGRGQSLDDNAAMADALAAIAAFERSASDAITGAEHLSAVRGRSAGAEDIAGVEVSLAQAAVYHRTLSDGLTIVDWILTGGSPFGFDGAGVGFDQGGFAPESVVELRGALSETLSRVAVYARTLSGGVTLSDALIALRGQSVGDSGQAGEALSQSAHFMRALTDALQIATELSHSRGRSAGADEGELAESIAATVHYRRVLSDSLLVASELVHIRGKAVVDSGAGDDALAQVSAHAREIADSGSGADSVFAGRGQAIGDAATATDALTQASAFARTLSDSLSGGDTLEATLDEGGADHVSSASDAGTLADSLVAVLQTPARPPAPVLSVSAIGATSARISWPVVDAYPAVTSYWWSYRPVGGSYGSLAELPASTLSYDLTGLAPETAYHFRVRAENSEGRGPNSRAEFTTLEVGPQAHEQTLADALTGTDAAEAETQPPPFGFDGAGSGFDRAPFGG